MKKSIQEKDKEQEKVIVRKFQKSQTINIIITMTSLFMLPILAIGGLLAEQRQLAIEKPLLYLCISMIGIMFLSNVFLRRCPHCGAFMGKYRFFPSTCHNCGVKLR